MRFLAPDEPPLEASHAVAALLIEDRATQDHTLEGLKVRTLEARHRALERGPSSQGTQHDLVHWIPWQATACLLADRDGAWHYDDRHHFLHIIAARLDATANPD